MTTEFVRVKDPGTGHEVTVPKRVAEAEKLTVLDKPAVDSNGRPLPGKPHVELAKADKPTDEEAAAAELAAAEAAEAAAKAAGNTNAGSGQQSGGKAR